MFRSIRKSSPLLGISIVIGSSTFSRTQCTSAVVPQFDLIVIGGGSGGLACAKRSAQYGAKVAIIEGARYGGTCVNVGCVPKKIMYNCAHVGEVLHEAHNFGYNIKKPAFDWNGIKQSRDAYIKRLNGIYETGLDNSKIQHIEGIASFVNANTISVNNQQLSAKYVVIATGGTPNLLNIPGEKYSIDSNGFFDLKALPQKVAVIGGGYIAVELAGVLKGLGSNVTLFVRGDKPLRNFDSMIRNHLETCMSATGIEIIAQSKPQSITKIAGDDNMNIHLADGRIFKDYDVVIKAVGRHPATASLRLENIDVKTSPQGHIIVDEYQNTNVKGVMALGDVCGRVELTPMAIAAGRRLGDRLFGNMPTAKADYSFVPTVVFSHPPIGTVGYTEEEARQAFKDDVIKVYTSTFINLWYGTYFKGGAGNKPSTKYKLVCVGKEERVVGLHAIGMASDEVIQGFAVAMKMGATKTDFDNCVAIHPTASEEFVTMAPWGLPGATPLNKKSI